jgi:hypothetical protein
MTTNEKEWESISALWRTSDRDVAEPSLRRLIAAQRRGVVAATAGEIAVLGGFLYWSLLVARDGVAAWEAVWLVTLWTFAAVAAGFAWWNRRGMWSAMGRSGAEYRRLSATKRLRSVRFGWVLFAAEILVVAAELAWFDRFTVSAAVILAALALPLGVWSVWAKRRAARDIELAGVSDEGDV